MHGAGSQHVYGLFYNLYTNVYQVLLFIHYGLVVYLWVLAPCPFPSLFFPYLFMM